MKDIDILGVLFYLADHFVRDGRDAPFLISNKKTQKHPVDDFESALTWLSVASELYGAPFEQAQKGLRVMSPEEQSLLSVGGQNFLYRLESKALLTPLLREKLWGCIMTLNVVLNLSTLKRFILVFLYVQEGSKELIEQYEALMMDNQFEEIV